MKSDRSEIFYRAMLVVVFVVTFFVTISCGGQGATTTTLDGSDPNATTSAVAGEGDPTTQVWDFLDTSLFDVDGNVVSIENGTARIVTANSQANFNAGSKFHTVATDSGSSLTVDRTTYLYRLPANSSNTGWIDMTTNDFLMHFSESSVVDGSTISESSGSSLTGTLMTGDGGTEKARQYNGEHVLSLDGVDDYVDLSPHVATFNVMDEDKLVMFWIKDETPAGQVGVIMSVSDGDDTTAPYEQSLIYTGPYDGQTGFDYLCVRHENDANLNINTCYNGPAAQSATLRDGEWHHVAIRATSAAMDIYIDGVRMPIAEYDSPNSSGGFLFNDTDFDTVTIGGLRENNTYGNHFKGQISELAIIDGAFFDEDILEFYARQAPHFKDRFHLTAKGATGANAGWMDGNNLELYHPFEYYDASAGGTIPSIGNLGFAFTRVGTVDGNVKTHPGVVGMAQYYDGIDDCSYHPTPAGMQYATGSNFTVMGWVKPTITLTNERTIFAHFDSGASQIPWMFSFTGTGGSPANVIQFEQFDGTSAILFNSNPIIEERWYHFAVVGNSTHLRFYIDGLEVDASPILAGSTTNTSDTFIGCNGNGGGGEEAYFEGSIDELAVFSRALSANDLSEIYFHQSPRREATYNSTIFSSPSAITWDRILWSASFPYGKPFLDEQAVEFGYESGVVSMIGNEFLLHFEGTGATVTDTSTSSGETGNIMNGTARNPGVFGQSIYLDNDAYIDFGTPSGLDFGQNDDFTIVFWMRPDFLNRFSTEGSIISRQNGGAWPYKIVFNPGTSQIDFTRRDGTTLSLARAYAFEAATGNWAHVAARKSGTELAIFVNGKKAGTATDVSAASTSNGGSLHVGQDPSGSSRFRGSIDELAIWSRPLNDTEIESAYLRGANQMKMQVRTCDDSGCSGETWMGPDLSPNTYFTEDPTATTPSTSIDISSLPQNSFMQYRVFLESRSFSNLPIVSNLNFAPTVFADGTAQILLTTGVPYTSVSGFNENRSPAAQGNVYYQLSYDNGSSWYYWDGSQWLAVTGNELRSDAVTINQNIASFSALGDPQTNIFRFRAFLDPTGVINGEVTLDRISLDYVPRVDAN